LPWRVTSRNHHLVGDTGLEDVAPTLEPLYGAVFSYEPNLLN